MNFLMAVKMLEDGKCEKIKSPTGITYELNNTGVISCGNYLGIKLPSHSFLGNWTILGKPRTEERIFKYWLVIHADGYEFVIKVKPSAIVYKQAQQVIPMEQRYIYTYPEEEEEECYE